jgi:hypothetical protein
MACKQWKNDWVAQLYGELEPGEERELVGHLEQCADCRDTLDGLKTSRQLLQDGAPHVPGPPRVVVLQPRGPWSTIRSFAAGVACAVVLFGLGLFAGPWLLDDGHETDRVTTQEPVRRVEPEAVPATDETLQDLQNDFFAMNERLAQLEGGRQLTAVELRKELDNLERRLNRERILDLEQVLSSFAAVERHTGSWMDQTDDRLTMLALRQDPRFIEQ